MWRALWVLNAPNKSFHLTANALGFSTMNKINGNDSLDYVLVEFKDGEAIKNLGEYNFYSRPESSDFINIGNVSGLATDRYKVIGWIHSAIKTEIVPQAPMSLKADNRKPVIMVELIENIFHDI